MSTATDRRRTERPRRARSRRFPHAALWLCAAVCAVLLAAAPCEAAEPVGWLASVQGDVRLVGTGGSRPADVGLPLLPGDAVETGVVGRAKLLLQDGAVVNLGDDSRLILLAETTARRALRLERGILRAWTHARPAPSARHMVMTPAGTAELEGGEVALRLTVAATEVLVFAGTASAAGLLGPPTRVEAGQRALLPSAGVAGPALGALPAEVTRAVGDTRVASRLRFESMRRAALQTGKVRREVALEKVKNASERKRKAAGQEAPKSSGDLSSTVGGADLDPLIAPAGIVKVTGHVGRRF